MIGYLAHRVRMSAARANRYLAMARGAKRLKATMTASTRHNMERTLARIEELVSGSGSGSGDPQAPSAAS